ncbi:glycoside hydrolase family 35 protein [Microbacterium sp. KNMS]
MSRFAIGEHDFLLDGEPFRVLAGALHYFRVHPDQWRDRIRKARAMGLNTIETYIAWNAHAPRRGEFRLDGGLDLGRFLDDVAAEGMHAIVRPGPYICAEWDNGGLPAWLFRDGAGVRRSEPRYLDAVREYYAQIAPVLVPRQIDAGGPIILMQVENEYGAFGDDAAYLREVADLTRAIGITVPLTTVDQPTDEMLAAGGLPDLHRTGSFGSRATERLATLRRHQPTGPLMCSEFWCGWFDSWGEHHHTTSAEDSARELDDLLAAGASVNIYMFHGGTNFGFTNGANDKGRYIPIVTSYDYDAPLDETGHPTAKYRAFRDVIAKYAPVPDEEPAAVRPDAPVFDVALDRALSLWDGLELLGAETSVDHLPTIDELDQFGGFTLYRATRPIEAPGVLAFDQVRDRAQVFLDRKPVGVLSRDHGERRIALPHGGVLELLVEDQGRVNYGPRLGEPTGLIGPATLDGAPIDAWEAAPLTWERLDELADRASAHGSAAHAGPGVAFGMFDAPAGRDLLLDTSGWGKGVVWVNGFCLGRFWSRGPQRTMYVPGPVVRETGNRIAVLELHAGEAVARFVAQPDLGHTEL